MLGSLGWFEVVTALTDKILMEIEIARVSAQLVTHSVSLFSTESIFALFDFRLRSTSFQVVQMGSIPIQGTIPLMSPCKLDEILAAPGRPPDPSQDQPARS